jgi:hypothetical protein
VQAAGSEFPGFCINAVAASAVCSGCSGFIVPVIFGVFRNQQFQIFRPEFACIAQASGSSPAIIRHIAKPDRRFPPADRILQPCD